jgi:hypothetical protein
LYGTTSSTTGDSAVAGVATNSSGSAHGVYGRSSNGQGVYGESDDGSNGVEGHGYTGVAGYGDGMDGTSGGPGVYGDGFTGAEGESSGAVALMAASDDPATYIFLGLGTNNASCVIDPKANLKCTGKITGKRSLRVQHHNSEGQQVLAYASESASATIEDVGTARMYGGVANVEINPDFAEVIDHRWYCVFLTPLGDTRGLYVSGKTPSRFQVRETERGRSTLDFDYRIVGRPLDAKGDRLPLAPVMKIPTLRRPAR